MDTTGERDDGRGIQQQIHPYSLLFPLPSPGAVLAPGYAGKITKLTSLK